MTYAVGRVVRWDDGHDRGAVIVSTLPVELAVQGDVVSAPGDRTLQPGELVEIDYSVDAEGAYLVHRACPTDQGT